VAVVSQDQVALLASIVDSSDDAIVAMTPGGVITSWNRGAEKIYGYSAEEIVGEPISVLTHAERPNEMIEILQQIRNGQRVEHYETARVRKDGRPISVSLTVSPIHDPAGRLVGVSSIARDISERKRADEKLRATSQYARSLIEASLDPLVTISPEGKITDVNEATTRVTGVPRATLIGTDFSDYFTEPGQAREGYQQVFSMGSVTDYPLTIRHKDGRLTDVLYNASLYKNAQNEVLGVFAAARNVTEQNRASQYARSLIEASLDPLVTISPAGKITDVNDATVKVTGVPREKLIDTDFSDYFIEPDKAREGYQQVFAQGFVTDYPLTIHHTDGRLTDVLYNASVYKDARGNVLGVFAAARDVTAQKQASQQVQTSLREKEVLLQEVHHRVKNNLQVISSLINMQVRKLRDVSARSALEECQSRVLSIALIHQKLYQSKDYGRVPFSGYARSLAANIFHATGISPGHVALCLEFETLVLAVDKAIPCGLILNELITNALKHGFPNDRRGEIRIQLKKAGGDLELSVADDGVGIDPGFDPAKSDSLGMQLVQTLVEQLDGKLDIFREAGTTFRVRFPMEINE
jgi:PAS domain S-box-containing protein